MSHSHLKTKLKLTLPRSSIHQFVHSFIYLAKHSLKIYTESLCKGLYSILLRQVLILKLTWHVWNRSVNKFPPVQSDTFFYTDKDFFLPFKMISTLKNIAMYVDEEKEVINCPLGIEERLYRWNNMSWVLKQWLSRFQNS